MGVKRSHDHAMTGADEDAAPASTSTPATRVSSITTGAGKPQGQQQHQQKQHVAQRQHADDTGAAGAAAAPVSPFMPMFEHFRAELDEHHDRRERVIKASRDVTAASKKM